jgi:uncharacterized protein (DUF2236 family)
VEYSDGLLDELRMQGDPTLDAIVADLAATGEIRTVSKLLRHLVDNAQPVPEELPDAIQGWLEGTAAVPEWADRDRIARGANLVVDHGPQVALILATASLVYCYAGYPGVKVLNFSHRMDHDPYRRVGETAQFVLAVTNPGGMDDDGSAIRKIQKVRVLHASIRHLISNSPRWDARAWGVPICQEDLVGTLMTFSHLVVLSLRKLGVRVSEQEAEDYLYLWRVVGEMLGVAPEVIPQGTADAVLLEEAIRRRNHQRSEDGVAMTAALLEMHANTMPGPRFDGLTPALLRFLLGDEVCDLVDVPHSSRWERAMSLNARLGRALDMAQSGAATSSLMNMLGSMLLNTRAVEMAGNRNASFSIPVPAEMQRRWTASGVFPAIETR